MGNALKFAGGGYLKVGDLHGQPPRRERISFAKEESGQFGDRLVLFFETGAKLSLNATSVGILARDLGAEYDAWSGAEIEVFCGLVNAKAGPMDALLVRVIGRGDGSVKQPPKAVAPPSKKPAANWPNDEPTL